MCGASRSRDITKA